MNNKLFQLLKRYNISEDTDYQAANQCLNNLNKWQQFIESSILPGLQDDFRKDLHLQLFEQDNQQIDQMVFFEQFIGLQKQDIYLQKIGTLDITDYKWSDSALKQIQNKTRQMIQKNIDISSNLSQFLKNQIGRIFDILCRKTNLKTYFDNIKQIVQSKKISKFTNLLKSLNFSDFIIIISHYIEQKQLIGEAMYQVGIPIPIYYQISSEKYIVSQITKNILCVDKYSLILNIGSPQTRNCGKTSFLAKIMNIDENNVSSSCYFSNTIHVYNKFSFSNSQKSLLIDFNGGFSNSNDENLKKFLYIISQCSSLLIIHLSQSEIQNKLLETEQYRRVCDNIPKILIYVRDHKNMTLNKLKTFIPQYMNSKTLLRCLRNFSERPITKEQNVKNIGDLVQASYNILSQKKVNIFEIWQRHKNGDIYHKVLLRIFKLMKYIDHPDCKKQYILPNVCKSQKLFDNFQLIRKQTQSGLNMKNYQDIESLIKKQLKNPQLSRFAQQAIQILSNQRYLQQIFRKIIYQWKKKRAEPLREQFIQLTEHINNTRQFNMRNQLIRKLEINKQMRSNYQLSLDTIINELVFYLCPNGKIIDHKARLLVKNYYNDCMKNVSPINIIQGNTLTFGNQFIQDIIDQLNHIYDRIKKLIYVVSVIGAQSSAKSTLLNYLFRCKFQTSAGRCTKGIYMSICQLDDLVIVVLDTEGLLSISERNKVFDHQIATFVLKISNLIIINNKGQLTNTLKEMLQVCLYVLNCLHKDQSKSQVKQYNPQKILFTLRDQDKPKGKFQEQMAAQIKNSLQEMNEKSGVDYKKFLSIEAEDIFSLPNPFNLRKSINNQTPNITLFEQNFGDCIIGLRKRIIDYLRGTKSQQNLTNFYKSAKKVWQTIQVCGQQIMYYKNINEIVIKKEIQNIYLSKIDGYQNICINSYDNINHIIQSLTKSDPQQQSNLNQQLSNINQDNYLKLSQQFKKSSICTNKQIISQYLRKIKKICSDYFYLQQQKLNNAIQAIKRSEKDAQIKSRVNQFISNSLDGAKDSELILQKYDFYTQNILKQLQQYEQKFQQAEGQIILSIRRIFEIILQKVKDWQLKINNIVECQQKYLILKKQWCIQSIIQLNYRKNQQNSNHYKNLLQNIFQLVQSNVINYLKSNNIKKHSRIRLNPQWCFTQFQYARQELLTNIRNDKHIIKNINMKNFHIIIFGLIFKITKQFIIKSQKAQYFITQNKLKKTLEFGKKQISKFLQINGNFIKAICHDINVYSNQLINNKISAFEHKIKQNIAQLGYKLNPQRIFLQAMKETFLNDDQQNQKQYYIKCYKLVSNINQYLFQILCNSQLITTRNSMISLEIDKIIQATDIQLSKVIQQIKLRVDQNNNLKTKTILMKNGMICLAHFDFQNLPKNLLLVKLINAMKIARQKILSALLNKIRQICPQKMIQHYISSDLKQKIIGCQICCPICTMKCMLQANHQQNHKISQKCHSLAAFGGTRDSLTNQSYILLCQQKANLTCKWKYGNTLHQNLKQLIDMNHPQWSDQFPNINEEHKFQNFGNATKLKRIWANIQNAIILSKKFIILQQNPTIFQLKDTNQLTLKDLQVEYQKPLTKQKYKLKQFHQIKINFDLGKYRSTNFIESQNILSQSEINENDL